MTRCNDQINAAGIGAIVKVKAAVSYRKNVGSAESTFFVREFFL